jgi:hypothetical protein
MIRLEFNLDDLRPDQAAAAEQGALNPDQVHFQYICSTEGGGHDPDGEPDERVRDSHKALHGTIWRLDDPLAPVPPIGYGCRCGMRYCGAPGSVASVVLGAESPAPPTTVPQAFSEWLTPRIPSWQKYADMAQKLPPADRLGAVYLGLKSDGVSGDLRELARMIVSAGVK